MTNYGKVDILWYDVAWPLDAKGWESEKMNEMVFKLQPDIIVNNRNKLPGDFSTPEQRIEAAEAGREGGGGRGRRGRRAAPHPRQEARAMTDRGCGADGSNPCV